MKQIKLFISVMILCSLSSCKKFLDKKSSINQGSPSSLSDYQGLMDQDFFHEGGMPQVGELGADNYYLPYTAYQAAYFQIRTSYIWASDIWQGYNAPEWYAYSEIYQCNVVLEGLDHFEINSSTDQAIKNDIYGQALFYRAAVHYGLEEIFGQPYKPSSANTDLGIPMKLKSGLEAIAVRSTVQKVYEQIINDLLRAKDLLGNTSIAPRPDRAAVFCMLARVCLSMQDYARAGAYADSSISINNTLFDYNSLSTAQQNSNNPFSQYSPPLKFPENLCGLGKDNYSPIFNITTTLVDSTLYSLYDANDLRKIVFFAAGNLPNSHSFKSNYSLGGYEGVSFGGPAVDESYLTRAECYARTGNKNAAMADLNTLLITRWKTGTFIPLTAVDANDALHKILTERRKELVLRGTRWPDLRRLNQDPQFAVTLTRILNGQVYTLLPNDKKYTYPIPDNEIQISGIQQNPR